MIRRFRDIGARLEAPNRKRHLLWAAQFVGFKYCTSTTYTKLLRSNITVIDPDPDETPQPCGPKSSDPSQPAAYRLIALNFGP